MKPAAALDGTYELASQVPGYVAVITCPQCAHQLSHIDAVIDNRLEGTTLALCTNPQCRRRWTITLTITETPRQAQTERSVYG